MLPQVENEIATWHVAEKKATCLNYLQIMHFYSHFSETTCNTKKKTEEVLTEAMG